MSLPLYPFARIVRDFLVEEGVGFDYSTGTDWAIATQKTPKLPHNAITVFDEAALKRDRPHSGTEVREDPVVSIMVRSEDHKEGFDKAIEVQTALDGLDYWTWTGDSDEGGQTVLISKTFRTRGIYQLGEDDNKRNLFNLEFSFTLQTVTG